MRALTLDEANTIIAATFTAAKKHKCRPMSAIVLDAGGRVKAFQKQDHASMLRFEVCYGKAYGALALGRPSKLVLQKANEKPLFMQSIENLADYPLFLEGGGQLIRDKSGEVVAAIGVTGDANEMDDICAIAGIHAAGYRADSVVVMQRRNASFLVVRPRGRSREGGRYGCFPAEGRGALP